MVWKAGDRVALHNLGDLQEYDGCLGVVDSVCEKGDLFDVIVEGGDRLCNLGAAMLQSAKPHVIRSTSQVHAPMSGAGQVPLRSQATAVRQLLEVLHAQSSTVLD